MPAARRRIGMYASMMPFAAVFGPVVGGVVVQWIGWRATFGLNAPFGLAICALGFFLLPAGRRRPIDRIDFLGIGLIGLTVTALVFALTELGRRDAIPNYAIVVVALAIFVASAVVLVQHERRTPSPAVDLDLLKRPPFASVNFVSLCFGMAWSGIVSIIPLYAQTAYGLSVAQSGTLSAPRGIVMVAVSSMSAVVVHRTGFRKPIVFGLLGIAASLVAISLGIHEPRIAGVTIGNFWWLMLLVGSAGFFFGFANPSLNNAGIELAPDRVAAIVGLRGMFMNLGSTLGISVVVLIASRASSTVTGLQDAFLLLAAITVLSCLSVFWIPEYGSARRASAGMAAHPVDGQQDAHPEAATAAGRRAS